MHSPRQATLEPAARGLRAAHKHSVVPAWMFVPGALAMFFLLVPFVALCWRVEWGQLWPLLQTPASLAALRLSIGTSLLALVVCIVLGVPLAFLLAADPHRPLLRVLRTLVTMPMVLPPVVAGLVLLVTWGRMGLIGRYLNSAGITIGFTTVAVIFAQVFVSLPFLVSSLEASLRTRGFALEGAARSLGASRTRTLFAVTLPVSAPALVSSIALAYARSLGEFGATIVFAGSLQGVTRTLPLEIYLQRETDTQLALTLSLVLLFIALLVVGSAALISGAWHRRLLQGSDPRWRPPLGSATDSARSAKQGGALPLAPGNASRSPRRQVGGRIQARVSERRVHADFVLAPGKVTALLGPNGAGKSTILALLAGRLASAESRVAWSGNGYPEVVELTQHPLLFPNMSIEKNVAFGLRCRGVRKAEALRQARAELGRVGLEGYFARRPSQLSGGQAQRAALARALVIEPDVALLDEPFSSLDVEAADALRKLVRARLAGLTTVIVTHNFTDVAFLEADCVVMRAGQVVSKGTWRELLDQRQQFVLNLVDNAVIDRI